MADDLDIPIEKFHCIIEEYGNTAASSIPLSLDLAVKAGKLKRGQKLSLLAWLRVLVCPFRLSSGNVFTTRPY